MEGQGPQVGAEGAQASPEGGRAQGLAPLQQQRRQEEGEVDGFVLIGDLRDEPGSSPTRPTRTKGAGPHAPPPQPSEAVRKAEAAGAAQREKPMYAASNASQGGHVVTGATEGQQLVAEASSVGPRKKGKGVLANAPRHLGDGLVDGVKSIAFGVGAGAASLVAMPVMGAAEEGEGGGGQAGGVTGLMKGLAMGVLGAVVLPVVGVVQGVGDIVGGVINTPETVASTVAGKEWDPLQKKWVHYSLNEEAQRVLTEEMQDQEEEATRRKKQPGGSRGGPSVKDTGLYDLLGVAPDADADTIKKAYYRTARRVHPDKNPNDAEAHSKFQQLSQAYQVLSNDQLRAAYDRDGAEALASSEGAGLASVDPALFFNLLFGSERFEPYTGKLKLAVVASAVGEMVKSPDGLKGQDVASQLAEEGGEAGDKAKRVQNTREVKCAMHLVALMEPWVSGGVEGEARYSAWCENEAAELAKGTFGPTMLVTVGWSYENQALEFLGGYSFLGVEALGPRLARTGNTIMKQADMGVAAVGALRAAKDLSATMQEQQQSQAKADAAKAGGGASSSSSASSSMGGSSPEAMARAQAAMENAVPVFVQAAWKMSALEIQETLGHVCGKVLRDKSVPEAQRKRRAQAMLQLGRAFRVRGEAELARQGGGAVDAKRQVEEALHKAVAASLGQEL